MKFSKLFAVNILIIGLIVSVSMSSYLFFSIRTILEQNLEDHLRSLTKAHSDHIQTFLDEKIYFVIDFGLDHFIRDQVSEINEKGHSETIMNNLSIHLIEHDIIGGDFYEVFILDANGKVIGTTNPQESFGEDFSEDELFLETTEEVYIGDFSYDEEFDRKGMVFSVPLIEEHQKIGVIVLRMSIDRLVGLIKNMESSEVINELGVGELGHIYLLNDENLLITPSKFLSGESKGILLQEVDNENTRNCFSMNMSGVHIGHNPIISFLDYMGEEVIGTHDIIPKVNWCLLVEVNKDEMLNLPLRKFIKNDIFLSLILSFLLAVFGYFIGEFLDKKYLLKKKEFKNGKR